MLVGPLPYYLDPYLAKGRPWACSPEYVSPSPCPVEQAPSHQAAH